MSRTAVLLVNLGSPASPAAADVKPYLDEFLMDPYVLDVPGPLRALLVRGLILRSRPTKSAEAYAKIWTDAGSPLVVISQQTRGALETALAGVPVGLAMRYGEPSIVHGIDELLARSGPIDELLVVPLYPHYAMASTLTVEVAVAAALRERGVAHRFLAPFYDDPGYLDALTARVRADLPADTYLLFSYHGIPGRHVKKLDPTGAHCLRSADCCESPSPAWATCYRHQVLATMRGVAERLDLAPEGYGFAFQSRLGGGWLEPFTDRVLAELPKRGVQRLAVVCPSFVADCLETLEEMALRGRATFVDAGGADFTYIPCLNVDPAWIDALAALCRKAAPVAA